MHRRGEYRSHRRDRSERCRGRPPVAIYSGDQRDRSKAEAKTNQVSRSSSDEISQGTAQSAKTRTEREVQSKLEILAMPELGALPKDPKRYTIVPGLTEYRDLQPHERSELSRVMEAAPTWSRIAWIDKVWSHHELDYKHRLGWGPSYADFGNLVYGATGKEVGWSDRMLYAGGGLAQQLFPESRRLYDPKNGSFIDFLNWKVRDSALFGDRPEDHEKITAGIHIRENFDLIRTLEGESQFGLKPPMVRPGMRQDGLSPNQPCGTSGGLRPASRCRASECICGYGSLFPP